MSRTIKVTYPESLANALKMSDKDFEKEIKMSALVKLFELGKISSGTAARVLEISRVDFLDRLAHYKVSVFDYPNPEDLNEDIANA